MKYFLLCFTWCAFNLSAQTLAFQSFDTPGWNCAISIVSGAPVNLVQSGIGAYPSNSTYGKTGSQAFTMTSSNSSNSSSMVLFDPINTSSYPMSILEFDLQALGLSGTGAGMDATYDRMEVAISLNNGLSFYEQLVIRGRNAAYWSYDSSSVLNIPFTTSSRTDIQMILGGECKREGFGKVRIVGVEPSENLVIRFRFYSNRTNELWSLDNVRLFAPIFFEASQSTLASQAANYSTGTVPTDTDWLYVDTSAIFQVDANLSIAGLIVARTCTISGSDTLRILNCISLLQDTLFINAPVFLSSYQPDHQAQWLLMEGYLMGHIGLEYELSGTAGWRHWSTPFETDLQSWLSGLNSQFNVGVNSTIYGFDAANADWHNPLGSDSAKHLGWSVYVGGFVSSLPMTYRTSGKLNLKPQFIEYVGGVPSLNSTAFIDTAGNSGWNFVGNPFPFPVSWESVVEDVNFPANVSKTFYLWDAHTNSYSSYNPISGSINGGLPWIPSGSGFFIQADAGATGSFQIDPHQHSSPSVQVSSQKSGLKKQLFEVSKGSKKKFVSLIETADAFGGYDSRYDHRNMGDDGSDWSCRLLRLRAQFGDTMDYKLKSIASSDTISTFLSIVDDGLGGEYFVRFSGDEIRTKFIDLKTGKTGTVNDSVWAIFTLAPGEQRLLKFENSTIRLEEENLPEIQWKYAKQMLLIEDETPIIYQLLDMNGNHLMWIESNRTTSIAALAAGIYVIRASGRKSIKMIKPD